jgi:hypothetical protein
LFWEPSNLAAACGRCNYGDGARIAAENTRATIARLKKTIWRQDAEIARLSERLALYEDANDAKAAPHASDPLTAPSSTSSRGRNPARLRRFS